MWNKWLSVVVISFFLILGLFILNQNDPEVEEVKGLLPFTKSKASVDGFGVSAGHPLAVEIGMDVLEKGGNAIDAAVAVSYALAVVEPYGSGLGGGGAMVIVPGNEKDPIAYDYRETAPLSGANTESYIGVPGFVKGMEQIHQDLGSLSFHSLLQPAFELAENGFEVNTILTERLQAASGRLPVDQIPHFFPNGAAIRPGETLVQKDLANTIKSIQENNSETFYDGEISEKLVAQLNELSADDMKSYTVVSSKPVEGNINDHTIYSAPPPLAGITVVQMLQMAEIMGMEKVEDEPENFIHLLGEIFGKSNQSRIKYLGDMNFTNVPINELTDVDYAKELSSDILFDQLSKPTIYDSTPADDLDHSDTTHFVIYDQEGTMVSATHSLSNFFGSGVYAEGMFFNNQLMNFSQTPSSPNYIEPGKRARSFMAPTILVEDGKPIIGIGSPGGRRIPIVISQVLIRYLLHDLSLQEAIDAPRFYVEDRTVYLENEVPDKVKEELIQRGYKVVLRESPVFFGGIQSLLVDHRNDILSGGADRRRSGTWETKNE
jgi:gamma-glutamyltranspeptidase/glutathione hydrolase